MPKQGLEKKTKSFLLFKKVTYVYTLDFKKLLSNLATGKDKDMHTIEINTLFLEKI